MYFWFGCSLVVVMSQHSCAHVIFLCFVSVFAQIVKLIILQDAMCVARNMIKNPRLVPGGGAAEMAVSASLKQKSSFVDGVDKVGKCSVS